MDGLSIRNSQKLLDRGQTTSEIRANDFRINQPSIDEKDGSFAETLNNSIMEVNKLQKVADTKMQALATGKTTNIAEVMTATERADIALRLMTKVRNKIIDAYQEVMKMQV